MHTFCIPLLKQVHLEEWLARSHMEGKVVIPGHPAPNSECPADLLEQEPAAPKLNVVTSGRGLYPKVPEDLVKERFNMICLVCLQKTC